MDNIDGGSLGEIQSEDNAGNPEFAGQNGDEGGDSTIVTLTKEETESKAKLMGWTPKHQYNGARPWVDAETFIAKAEIAGPILKERNEHLIKEIQELKQKFEENQKVTEQFKQFQVELRERKESEYKAQIAELKSQRAEAIRNGDGDAVNDIEDRIDTLKERTKEVPKVEEPKQVPPHPDFEGWKAENAWFDSDITLQEDSVKIATSLRALGDKSEGRVFFDKVKERLMMVKPDKFGNQNRKTSKTDTGNTGSVKGKTWADIPSDDAKAGKTFISQGLYKAQAKKLGISEEQVFLREYFA